MSQLLKDLLAVDNLLSNEARWCQHNFARDKNGVPVNLRNRRARSWCLVGAIERTLGNKEQRKQDVINNLDVVIKEFTTADMYQSWKLTNISEFNDSTDFTTIKALLAAAIQHALNTEYDRSVSLRKRPFLLLKVVARALKAFGYADHKETL